VSGMRSATFEESLPIFLAD